MKLCDEVKSVLDKACPVWMQLLCAVDFNIQALADPNLKLAINNSYARCFIGEIHNNDDSYRWNFEHEGDFYCNVCTDFACEVILVFDESKTIEQRADLLKEIADHVKEKHPELMNKKPLENDC